MYTVTLLDRGEFARVRFDKFIGPMPHGFYEAQAYARRLPDFIWKGLREQASHELIQTWPAGQGIGTSDISIAAIEMCREIMERGGELIVEVK